MNEKKFRLSKHGTWLLENDRKLFHWYDDDVEVVELLNELHEENLKLKSENNMLRVTIGRNEAYIGRLTHQSEWSDEAKSMYPLKEEDKQYRS